MDPNTRLGLSYLFGLGAIAVTLATGIANARARRLACSTKFQPARLAYGKRDPRALHLIVLHSTESTGLAANVASYFQSPSAGGSANLVVGEDGCFRSVPDLQEPAGAPGTNSDGLHIEIVGLAKWTRDEWLHRAPRAIDLAARALAEWSVAYGIPLAFVGSDALKTGHARGVTTHAEVSKAFKKSDHWDPGPGFPLDVLLERARMYA